MYINSHPGVQSSEGSELRVEGQLLGKVLGKYIKSNPRFHNRYGIPSPKPKFRVLPPHTLGRFASCDTVEALIRQLTPSTTSTRSWGHSPTSVHSPWSVLMRSLQLYSFSSCAHHLMAMC